MITMYGIPNCDSIKKAKRWLDEHAIAYQFHNYKKDGIDAATLAAWVEQVGWEILLNKRGTTWRNLSDTQKADIDSAKAIALLCDNPSMIKRPVLNMDGRTIVGFSEQSYGECFA